MTLPARFERVAPALKLTAAGEREKPHSFGLTSPQYWKNGLKFRTELEAELRKQL